MSRLLRLATVTVAAALLTPAGAAHAHPHQSSNALTLAKGQVDGPSFDPQTCSGDNAHLVDVTCSGGGVTGRTYAYVDAENALHSGAWGSRTGNVVAGTYRTYASATFADQLSIVNAGAASTFHIELMLHGALSGPSAFGMLQVFAAGAEGNGSEPALTLALDNTVAGDQTVRDSFDVPLIGGVADFSLLLQSDAYLNVPDASGHCTLSEGCAATVAADLSHTARIARIVALDADGNEVDGVVARSASGVSYTLQGGTVIGAVATVPEPASLALIGAGLVPAAVLARRRRAA